MSVRRDALITSCIATFISLLAPLPLVSKRHPWASRIVLACHLFSKPTFHTAAARLQHPGVHVGLGVGEQLVSSQVRVVGRGDEVAAQGLLHVLVHLVVQRIEDVARWAAHEICESWWKCTEIINFFFAWMDDRCMGGWMAPARLPACPPVSFSWFLCSKSKLAWLENLHFPRMWVCGRECVPSGCEWGVNRE